MRVRRWLVSFWAVAEARRAHVRIPVSLVLLVPLLPLVGAIMIGVGGRGLRERVVKLAAPTMVLPFIGAGITLGIVATRGAIDLRFYDPAVSSFSLLSVGFHIDRLAAVMMLLISAVSTVIYLFSMRFMQQDRGYARFHSLLALSTFVLLCMVSSANLFMLLVFWQVLSWLLYMLSYNYAHGPTLAGAFRTFTMNRVGEVAFLAGVVLAYSVYGTLEFQPLFERAAAAPVALSVWAGGPQVSASTAITALLFIGAMAKSAQFPLHGWLPGSLFAPTPVHALLHAGIINAGGFLINRLAPLYGLSPTTLHVAFAVGLITALSAAFMMLTQNDIKKTLGYSTIGQMGYMIVECGLGAFALAVFHLIAHGIFKATVFLNCGNVIHKARQEPRFPPREREEGEDGFSVFTWLTGFTITLIIPLAILLSAHGLLRIPMKESQGTMIFLFLSWVTSSQAILTLYRLRAVASWKVAATMFAALVLVVFTYLAAAEAFTHFLYPGVDEAARYFRAAVLPPWLFDALVAVIATLIMSGWFVIYADAHGKTMHKPQWIDRLSVRLYLFLLNRLYLDALHDRVESAALRVAHRLDKRYLHWLP
jgi:NADH-quinone oxidoreductase subunit L